MKLNLDKKKNFETFCGIVIAFFTFMLIIESIYSNQINDEMNDARMDLSSNYDFYQAKKNRQVMYQIAYEYYEVDLLKSNNSPKQIAKINEFIDKYKKYVKNYESDPDLKEGKSEILKQIERDQNVISMSENKYLWLRLAESLLQISIVLLSVSLIISSKRFMTFGIFMGIVGIFSGLSAAFLV